MNWIEVIDDLLPDATERESQRKFLLSVRRQVAYDNLLYPTVAQKQIVLRLKKHIEKKRLSDVEREVLAMYSV